MNLIDKKIKELHKCGRTGLMTHAVLGFPTLAQSKKVVLAMAKGGADFIEMQIPFSDPLGDGSVIRRANTVALKKGFRVKQSFSLARSLRQQNHLDIPLLFMTYYNIVFNFGVEKFCRQSAAAGIDGLIIPDYPPEAEPYDDLRLHCRRVGLKLIRFLSLDSLPQRIESTGKSDCGFVYFFARRGVTGSRQDLSSELGPHLLRLKKKIRCPLAVGFGVSRPEHIRQLKNKADMVIVGSAVLEEFNKNGIKGVAKLIDDFIQVL